MYDYNDGSYTFHVDKWPKESIYKFETTFYIKYNSSKALFAISKLFGPFKGNLQDRCFFYHIYLDLLFESVGQLINRFNPVKKPNSNIWKNIENQAEKTKKEYGYDKRSYQLLTDKDFRNFIEHIDEKDEVLVNDNLYFGTFNLIYPHMNKKIKENLLNPKKPQNNLLNLIDKTYTIYFVNNKNNKKEIKTIDLKELKKEIEEINVISNRIWNYLNDELFKD